MVCIMPYKDLTKKKKRLDSLRPLQAALVKNLDDWFRVELTYTSNALEGNTLTRCETALVVEKGLTVGGKSLVEHLEAIQHAHALDWIKQQAKRKPSSLKEKDILDIHYLILTGIDSPNAGCYRSIPVRIAGSAVALPHPLHVPHLMTEFIQWLNTTKDMHPVKLAAEAHYQLVTIHPFVDGNGRTARLLMNMLLIMMGYPPAIIRKRDRLAYLNSLEKAQRGGAKEDYWGIISKAVDRSLMLYINAAQGNNSTPTASDVLLKIGQLAEQSGVRHSTLRHWTKEGLLDVAETTAAGYQLYAPTMIKRIKKIQQLKKQRLTLQEIKNRLS